MAPIYFCYQQLPGFGHLLLVLANVLFYSVTLAPLLWVVLSEIFPNRIRKAAMSIEAFAHWVGTSRSLSVSQPSKKIWGERTTSSFIVLYLILPETKGKTLEEIEHELIDGRPSRVVKGKRAEYAD